MLKRHVLLILGTVAVGCTAKDGREADSAAATSTAAPQPNVVTFTTKEFAFEGPDTIPAGLTTLVLNNAGATLHHVQLVRLKDGKTFADFEAGLKSMKPTDPPPPWVEFAGGVNTPAPGGQSKATLTIEPGTYAVICFVDLPDKVPHFAKGMVKGLTVTPSTATAAAEPTADVTLTLSDYTFAFSPGLTPGQHMVKISNTASQPHEFVLFQLLPGKTMDDFGKFAATYKGEMPAKAIGGIPSMAPGQTEYVPLDLAAGDYVAICFVPDAKDGKPHVEHGMVMPIRIG